MVWSGYQVLFLFPMMNSSGGGGKLQEKKKRKKAPDHKLIVMKFF